MSGLAVRLAAVVVLSLACACSEQGAPEFSETVEVIALPASIGSFKVAHQIGTDVHHEIVILVENEPEKFDTRKVDYQINWGKMENFDTGETIFYIKIVGKSVKPVEEDPTVRELMQRAIDSVHRKIRDYENSTLDV